MRTVSAPNNASADPDAKQGVKYGGSIAGLRKAISANPTAESYLNSFTESGGKLYMESCQAKLKVNLHQELTKILG
jgi:hypothetical protein